MEASEDRSADKRAPPVLVPGSESQPPPKSKSDRIGKTKDIAAIVQSVFTVVAIIAAGWWFWFGRQNEPRVRIDQSLTHFRVPEGNNSAVVAAIDVKVTNTGNVLVKLDGGHVDIDSIGPNSRSLDTQQIKKSVLEPGEQEQVYFTSIDVPDDIWAVQVYTQIPSPSHLSWHLASAFSIKGEEKEGQKATLAGSGTPTATVTTK